MERSAGSAPAPQTPAGWYPDPDQEQTVRYWDGQIWTEQRAPASPAEKQSVEKLAGTLIAVAGIGAVIIGLFLPYADTGRFGKIVDNTMLAQDTGKVLLALAIFAMLGVYRNHQQKGWRVSVLLLGLITLGLTLYMGAKAIIP
jgi:hypothetical protein